MENPSTARDASLRQNRYHMWEGAVSDAVAFAEQFPKDVRSGIVQTLLSSESPSTTARSMTGGSAMPAGDVAPSEKLSGIPAVAASAGVDAGALQRFIQVAADGTVTIRAPLRGSASHCQNAYSAILAYVREKGLNELDTESALVRKVCKEHGCLDRNLAANLRKREWLLEQGDKGHDKMYCLSPAGEQAAREEIVSLCAAG